MKLLPIFANMAGMILAIAALQILRVNRRFLPRNLRPPLWREILLAACSAFYVFFSYFVSLSTIRLLL